MSDGGSSLRGYAFCRSGGLMGDSSCGVCAHACYVGSGGLGPRGCLSTSSCTGLFEMLKSPIRLATTLFELTKSPSRPASRRIVSLV